jgi:GT2 family glycosyltransferase/glycosyltransferase involved in cell wall biosynthesis
MTGVWKSLATVATAVFLLTFAAPLLALLALVLLGADVAALVSGKRSAEHGKPVSKRGLSVVIPTWNGRDHLARNLPSLLKALAAFPEHEVLIMENASEDGTTEFLAEQFPSVRVVEMGSNLGFGRACNIGCSLARYDVVLMLNNDMRVEPDFIQPLLDGFRDPRVFAVTCQIFFESAAKPREETGLTMGRWHQGRIHLQHVADPQVDELFPTFYSGGGSTAYDRQKLLELGGFDELLAPFYMEDVDLAYMAWKRGWVNLYAPSSMLHHQHRGTIGRHYSAEQIRHVLQKNRLLFVWKNMHEWGRLAGHFGWLYGDMWLSLLAGESTDRTSTAAFLTALRQGFRAAGHRATARRLAEVSDSEALLRPMGGFFRDRFQRLESKATEDLDVLFVSPYPIEPPLHGGAVFMKQAVEGLAAGCRLHLLCLLERDADFATHRELAQRCASAELVLHDARRRRGAPLLWPQSAQSFWDPDLLWKIHRTILLRRIDIVQLEYAQLASYGARFRQLVSCLFEHDLHFQSVQRGMLSDGWLGLPRRAYEYLRALRFELIRLRQFDVVQVCSGAQRHALRALLGEEPPVKENLRTAIDVSGYPCRLEGREEGTVLFVGNFRHTPNLEALTHFRKCIVPLVLAREPSARFVVAGASAPDWLASVLESSGIEFLGPVADIREVLGRYAIFAAPILSGSGVRVKLLEAFASGIPVVATSLAAEGLCKPGDAEAWIEDEDGAFAEAIVALLSSPAQGRALARTARAAVERNWDRRAAVSRLLAQYRAVHATKLLTRPAYPLPLA